MIISNDPNNPYGPNPYSNPYTVTQSNPPQYSPGGSNWSGQPPTVIFWSKVYNGLMIALYAAVTVIGIGMVAFAGDIAQDDPTSSPQQVMFVGIAYAVVGILLAGIFVIGLLWRKGNGAWIYQIILIVLGMTSCCTWPGTIPLLIYWIKDRDKILQS